MFYLVNGSFESLRCQPSAIKVAYVCVCVINQFLIVIRQALNAQKSLEQSE